MRQLLVAARLARVALRAADVALAGAALAVRGAVAGARLALHDAVAARAHAARLVQRGEAVAVAEHAVVVVAACVEREGLISQ